MRINPKSRPAWSWLGFIAAVSTGMLGGWWFLTAQISDPAPDPRATQSGTSVLPPNTQPVVTPDSLPAGYPLGSPQPGSPAPDFTLLTLGQSQLSLSALRGEVVLINFWTTWCPPCRLEMPALQQVFDRYEEQGFVVLGVNWTEQDDIQAVGPYVEELGLTFPILLDIEGEVSGELYNIIGLPTSVFVDPNGIVSELHIGPLNLDDLDEKIQKLIEESR